MGQRLAVNSFTVAVRYIMLFKPHWSQAFNFQAKVEKALSSGARLLAGGRYDGELLSADGNCERDSRHGGVFAMSYSAPWLP
jgi:hypothetical protein